MKFYIAENGERRGPYTLEQLATMSIDADTLVWSEGMNSWERAADHDVLRAILIARSASDANHFAAKQPVDDAPSVESSYVQQSPPQRSWMRRYGCLLTFFLLILGLAATMWFTCPKKEAHKQVLVSLADEVVRDEMSDLTGGFGTTVAQAIVSGVVNTFYDDAFKTYDYHFVSVTRFDLGDNDKIVSVGLLGHVFTANKEAVKTYVHGKIRDAVKSQLDNVKRQIIPSESLRSLFDKFIGETINSLFGLTDEDVTTDSI